jgi:prevent-host-death family protein
MPVKTMSVSEVRNHLPEVVDKVKTSREEVVVTCHGKPMVRIVPYQDKKKKNRYPLRGLPIRVSESFDEPMPELWDAMRK